jgi:mannonate dehydratase
MGAIGIPILCYNFMAQIGWFRTSTWTRTRGGALATSFDSELLKDAPPAAGERLTEQQLWANLTELVHEIVPVAEGAGVRLALHPDDPPISPLLGVPRILTSVQALERACEICPSDYHGLAFCQATIRLMDPDLPAIIRRFGRHKKIHFVHIRDVRGKAEKFVESFHDDGETDMLEAIECYQEISFDGPARPDHAPTMEGEANDEPGYKFLGRIFAVGYIKGLLECAARTSHLNE